MTEEREKKRDPGFYDGKSCLPTAPLPTKSREKLKYLVTVL